MVARLASDQTTSTTVRPTARDLRRAVDGAYNGSGTLLLA
jgi:hypothetical protein